MSNLLSNEEFSLLFKAKFQNNNVEYRTVNLSDAKLYAFQIMFENESELSSLWMDIRNFIAFRFQTQLNDDFSKWNLYLFFIVKNPVNIELKYQIENDTFSSRKVVIDNGLDFDQIITEHIINKLDFNYNNPVEENEMIFKSDEIIGKVLTGTDIKGKKKVTIESKAALDEIIELIKKQSNEI